MFQSPLTKKLLLYRAVICPRLNWDFMVNEFPLLWVKTTLKATATRFFEEMDTQDQLIHLDCIYQKRMEA